MGELNKAFLDRLVRGTSELIHEDRPCADCGYNLKGLRLNGRCPECGAPISPNTSLFSSARPCGKCGFDLEGLTPGDSCPECGTVIQAVLPFGKVVALGESPRPWLKLLRIGCACMAIGGFAYSVLPAVVFVWSTGDEIRRFIGHLVAPVSQLGSTRRSIPNDTIVFGVALALAVCWAVGVWLVTRPRPRGTYPGTAFRPSAEWLAQRWLARAGATLGPASAFMLGSWIDTGSWISASLWFLVVAFAVIPALSYLSGLLFWARDDGMAWATRGAITLVGFTGVILVVSPMPVVKPLQLLAVFGGMIFMLGVAFGQWASFRMVSLIRWAIQHAEEAAAQDERRRRKAKEARLRASAQRAGEIATGTGTAMTSEQEKLLSEIERKHAAMAESEVGGESERPASGSQRVVEKGQDVEAFELEDEKGRGGGPRESL